MITLSRKVNKYDLHHSYVMLFYEQTAALNYDVYIKIRTVTNPILYRLEGQPLIAPSGTISQLSDFDKLAKF